MDIAELLTLAFEHHASDLHLSAGAVPMIRVDGDMQQLNFPVLENTQGAQVELCTNFTQPCCGGRGAVIVADDGKSLSRAESMTLS